ncbi:MAG: L,D-transpeptidase, partial [Chthoniobacterales bacterium]
MFPSKILSLLLGFVVLGSPLLAMPKPAAHTQGTPTGKPTGPLKPGEYWWKPDLSPAGPVVALVSIPQQVIHVYRNGILGRAAVEISGRGRLGSHVFTLLDGAREKSSAWVPGRPARKWMRVSTDKGPRIDADDLGRRVTVNPVFAAKLYDTIQPGTTVIVTDD